MERVLETLAISFVAIAGVWFVVAQAYGILNGFARRGMRVAKKLA